MKIINEKISIIIIIIIILLSCFLIFCNKDKDDFPTPITGSFIDERDDKTYMWVQLGNQVWMSENLAFKPDTGNYWIYNNDSAKLAKYGYLYNWETAQKVCPPDWHLPSDAEWNALASYVGGEDIAGMKLKEKGTTNWDPPNEGATNSSKFTALPSGSRDGHGNFYRDRRSGYWWTSTETVVNNAWNRHLNYNKKEISKNNANKWVGFSVRCVKD